MVRRVNGSQNTINQPINHQYLYSSAEQATGVEKGGKKKGKKELKKRQDGKKEEQIQILHLQCSRSQAKLELLRVDPSMVVRACIRQISRSSLLRFMHYVVSSH